MGKYRVIRESKDFFREDGSPHDKTTSLLAESPQDAIAICRRKEYEIAAFQLDPDEFARFQKLDEKGELKGNDKGRFFDHNQAEPAVVTSVSELSDDGVVLKHFDGDGNPVKE